MLIANSDPQKSDFALEDKQRGQMFRMPFKTSAYLLAPLQTLAENILLSTLHPVSPHHQSAVSQSQAYPRTTPRAWGTNFKAQNQVSQGK
jgi:hypothetical protein